MPITLPTVKRRDLMLPLSSLKAREKCLTKSKIKLFLSEVLAKLMYKIIVSGLICHDNY